MRKPFMDQDFLLTNDTARVLYHEYAAKMPIIDYHCHIDPKQICENARFSNLTEAWLGGDHYKWRAMRSNGIDEKYITGKETSDYEKFEKWAQTLPRLIGNPLYHWTHLELQRYFGIAEPLTPASCKSIWDRANEQLQNLSVRRIITQSRVKAICTTDDPTDDLRWHQLIKEDKSFTCRVLPAFRPDKAMNIDKDGFAQYIQKLGQASGLEIEDFETLQEALHRRLKYFKEMGCVASDHGLDYVMYEMAPDANQVLKKALSGGRLDQIEADAYKTAVLVCLAKLYKEYGIVMQLHYGAARSNNLLALAQLGPDTGFDAIWGKSDSGVNLGKLLGMMDSQDSLSKTIIYSLNPCDNAQIDAIIGCFQTAEHPGKIQHGSAWWFNDTKTGMTEQLTSLANHSVLGNFVGMLTDSRSFFSYTRHEYFRRILCNLIGTWVENGEYPQDMEQLGKMIEDISYNNALGYFDLKVEA